MTKSNVISLVLYAIHDSGMTRYHRQLCNTTMGKLWWISLLCWRTLLVPSGSYAFRSSIVHPRVASPPGTASPAHVHGSSSYSRCLNFASGDRPTARQPHRQQCERRRALFPSKLSMFEPWNAIADAGDISAWSVTSSSADLAADLFGASLLPYLVFLFFLSRPESKTPEGGTFGFGFLLVFVLATIPAGIYAKTEYNSILADVDYLHGLAESLLTITNLFIVNAFRKAILKAEQGGSGGEGFPQATGEQQSVLRSSSVASAVALLAAAPLMLATVHAEPANALSFPTWMVHVSSLVEWLAAMTFIWRYADTVGLAEWKGLTWGMLPLHTSGLLACTYHLFYNAPQLTALVATQAAMTCFGNSTMAFATWRVWQAGRKMSAQKEPGDNAAAAISDSPSSWSQDLPFYGRLLGITAAGAALVKWGELYLDFPFEPSYAVAALLILGPTVLNAKKWSDRSADPSAPFGGIF